MRKYKCCVYDSHIILGFLKKKKINKTNQNGSLTKQKGYKNEQQEPVNLASTPFWLCSLLTSYLSSGNPSFQKVGIFKTLTGAL